MSARREDLVSHLLASMDAKGPFLYNVHIIPYGLIFSTYMLKDNSIQVNLVFIYVYKDNSMHVDLIQGHLVFICMCK